MKGSQKEEWIIKGECKGGCFSHRKSGGHFSFACHYVRAIAPPHVSARPHETFPFMISLLVSSFSSNRSRLLCNNLVPK